MIKGLMVLVAYQLAGETITSVLRLPIPGALAGMLLLLCCLVFRSRIDADVSRTARLFLQNMGLLFVPSAVGLSLYFGLLVRDWPTILAATLSSAALTLIVTAWLHRLLTRGGARRD